jgi:hypothetical protein
MKPVSLLLFAGFLILFGSVTVFLSASVIVDLFGIRAMEGNYVLFVVWANFISGVLFLSAAYAAFMTKRWLTIPLYVSVIVLLLALLGLTVHITTGGLYETKTVMAMIVRVAVNIVLIVVYELFHAEREGKSGLHRLGLLLPLAALTVWGCSHGDKHDHGAGSEHNHHSGSGHEVAGAATGEKWIADDHTIKQVRVMENDVLAFDAATSDYKQLALRLDEELQVLIAGCTMKGSAHDKLHEWLHPFMDEVKTLSDAATKEEADASLIKIRESFKTFDQHFQ